MSVKEMSAESVAPVSNEESFTWGIKLYEYQGKCYISWTGPNFRAAQSQVWLVSCAPGAPAIAPGAIPAGTNPTMWDWVDVTSMGQPVDTGQLWGSGWQAMLVSQAGGSSGTMTQIVVSTSGTVD